MSLLSLQIKQFRNITHSEMTFSSYINVLYGENGSGKTSFLEAVYYLLMGRSFRSASINRLIKQTHTELSLFAQVLTEQTITLPLGLRRALDGETEIRLAEKEINSQAELLYLHPVRIINSQSHQLFESGPTFRRKFLDWGLFYFSKQFLHCWRQFDRVLKQRNTLLRAKKSLREIMSWTEELVHYGSALNALRQEYVTALSPVIQQLAEVLLGRKDVVLNYQQGWPQDKTYADALAHTYSDELRLGCTQLGPHRADFSLQENSLNLQHFLSRGQQKMMICAMILSQGMLLKKQANKPLIYLIDDLPAELDQASLTKLLKALAEQKTQVFLTAIEAEMVNKLLDNLPVSYQRFHVEQGAIKPAS